MVLMLLNDAKAEAIVNGDGEKIFHKVQPQVGSNQPDYVQA